jgi:hypothetical protein
MFAVAPSFAMTVPETPFSEHSLDPYSFGEPRRDARVLVCRLQFSLLGFGCCLALTKEL